MSITDELREWWVRKFPVMDRELHKDFTAIADRIDAEHERAMAAAALVAGVPVADENMAEHGWIRLPLDADGVPIHVGDVMDFLGRMTVDATDGHNVFFFADNWTDGVYCVRADELRHHHEPTVEDVLRDVVTLCHNTWKEESPFHFYDVDDMMKSGNIAEFASRLRLAEGDA